MRAYLACVFGLTLIACGADKGKESDEKEEAKTGDVEFTGYVQKAFAIKVNSKDFSDSEDFYTRFIEELVKPAYPDVADSDIKLEGKYGLDEFGSLSKVYMSSVVGEGHLYEGRTDAQSKFTIKVQAKALDETFKARIVVRIGLEVAKSGDGSDLHFCYLLHGNKEGIAISDSSKPIIFEEFATQLTKYKCEDVDENSIDIPGLEPQAVKLRAVVGSTSNIASALDASWQGSNTLTAAVMTKVGEVAIVKRAVKKGDGKWCRPIVRLASLTSAPSEECVGDEAAAPGDVTSVAIQDGNLVMSEDNEEHLLAIQSGTTLFSTNGKKLCNYPADDCKPEPISNKCDLGYPQTATWHAGAFMMANGVNSQGSGYCGADAIHVLSSALSYQKKYTVDVPDFASAKLVSDGTNLYLLSLAADKLVVRKLNLTEE